MFASRLSLEKYLKTAQLDLSSVFALFHYFEVRHPWQGVLKKGSWERAKIKPYIWCADAGQTNPLSKDIDVEEIDGVVEDPGPGLRRCAQDRLTRGSATEEYIAGIHCKFRATLWCNHRA